MDLTLNAQVHRLYTQDARPIGTIARELKLHHSTVERIVGSPIESRLKPVRGTIFDDHRKLINDALERWPELPARRLFDMCVERGFVGSPSHFRAPIRTIRPGKTPKAFLRLKVDPGQQGQVDWGHFGHVGFEPVPVGVRKGNEKGRVERAIRFIGDSLYPGRRWTDLNDLNVQAREWCLGRAAGRPWPNDVGRTVAGAFDEERGKPRTLSGDPFRSDDVQPVQIYKTPYARYGGND